MSDPLEPPSHRCPGPGCEKQVNDDLLACSQHWYQVPPAIRRAVYQAYNGGRGAGSNAHRAACSAAIRAMRSLTKG